MDPDGPADETTLDPNDTRDRPTIPVPRPSPVRIALTKVAYGSISLDVVVADLARDPRSEYCYERPSGPAVAMTRAIVRDRAEMPPGAGPRKRRWG